MDLERPVENCPDVQCNKVTIKFTCTVGTLLKDIYCIKFGESYIAIFYVIKVVFIYFTDATVAFNQLQYSIVEGNGPLKPSLVLSNPSSTNITIRIANDDSTATGKCKQK